MFYTLYLNGITNKVGVYTDYADLEAYVAQGLKEQNDATYVVYENDGEKCYRAYGFENGEIVDIAPIFFNRIF